MRRDLHEENRLSWNRATRAHNSHKVDQATFLRGGGTTLYPDEIALLGDLSGKRLLHLQCNGGPDSLSLAALGAEVTGVDISDEAIAYARQLSLESGIPARFERADLYDYFDAETERFDIAFASYGAIYWLSDIDRWAAGTAKLLAPDGRLVLIEFHPLLGALGDDGEFHSPYFGHGGPTTWSPGVHDYVAQSGEALVPWGFAEGERDFVNPHPCHEFNWTLGDVVTAVARAGLRVELLREYPYSNGFRPFTTMRELPGRRFAAPAGTPELPLMFGLVARKVR